MMRNSPTKTVKIATGPASGENAGSVRLIRESIHTDATSARNPNTSDAV